MELIEREAELAVVDRSISEAAAGKGCVVVVEGPAGIGKTSLVDQACRRAATAGMTVISGQGAVLEHDFGFGVVRQLFEPVVGAAAEDERHRLLARAAALAAPVVAPAELAAVDASPGQQAAIVHGLTISFRDRQLRVDATSTSATYSLVTGEALEISHYGQPLTVSKENRLCVRSPRDELVANRRNHMAARQPADPRQAPSDRCERRLARNARQRHGYTDVTLRSLPVGAQNRARDTSQVTSSPPLLLLQNVMISVRNLDRSVEFYEDVTQLRQTVRERGVAVLARDEPGAPKLLLRQATTRALQPGFDFVGVRSITWELPSVVELGQSCRNAHLAHRLSRRGTGRTGTDQS